MEAYADFWPEIILVFIKCRFLVQTCSFLIKANYFGAVWTLESWCQSFWYRVCSVTIPRWCLEQVWCWVYWWLQRKAHLRFIWFWRYSLLGPKSAYKGSLCSHDNGLCGCSGGSVVPHDTHWRMGESNSPWVCAWLCIGSHWLLCGETFTAHSESVGEMTLMCSDSISICSHYVPAGQLQVSKIKNGNWM